MSYMQQKVERMRREMIGDVKLNEYIKKQAPKISTEYQKRLIYEKYTELHGKSMTELLEEARADQKANLEMDEREICDRMMDFLQDLQAKKLDNSTIRTKMKHIRAFYNHYNIKMPKIRLPKIKRKQRAVLSIEDAKKGLQACKLRYKALFILQITSGMDISTACSMDYLNFIKSISNEIDIKNPFDIDEIAQKVRENKNIIGTWIYERVKSCDEEGGDEVYTFCTHECLLSLVEYLEWRQRIGLFPKSLNEPLFIKGEKGRIERILPSTAVKYAETKNDELEITKGDEKRLFITHSFRKMFSNALYAKKVDKLKIDWMLGHSVNDVDYAYFSTRENLQSLKEEYKECSEKLIFNHPEYIDKTDEKVLELQEKVENQDDEIKGLRARLEKAKSEGFNANMDTHYIKNMVRSEIMEEIKSEMKNEFLKLTQKEKGKI